LRKFGGTKNTVAREEKMSDEERIEEFFKFHPPERVADFYTRSMNAVHYLNRACAELILAEGSLREIPGAITKYDEPKNFRFAINIIARALKISIETYYDLLQKKIESIKEGGS